MKPKFIRYNRIFKHWIKYFITGNIIHFMEMEHYFYMKKFRAK